MFHYLNKIIKIIFKSRTNSEQMSINQRIKEARIFLGLSQGEVEKATEIKRSSISKIENGLMDVPAELLVFYIGTHHIPAEWLVTGKGTGLEEEKSGINYSLTGNNNQNSAVGTGNQVGGSDPQLRIDLEKCRKELEEWRVKCFDLQSELIEALKKK